MKKIKEIMRDIARVAASTYALAALAFMSASTAWGLTIVQSSKDDAPGKSSFVQGNASSIFGDRSHPNLDYDYEVVGGNLMRTPEFTSSRITNLVFSGHSLSLGNESTDAASKNGLLGIKTVYKDDTKRATLTIDDLRLYNYAVLNHATDNSTCRIAGNMTVYATSAGNAHAGFYAYDTARVMEISSAVAGNATAGIKFYIGARSEIRMLGDMSGYYGAVTVANNGRFVLACPYAAVSTTFSSGALTLGPNFSYVGSGNMAIPAGTRFVAGYDADAGTTTPVTLDAAHFTIADGKFEIALDASSISTPIDYAGKALPIVRIPVDLLVVDEDDFTDVTSNAPTEHGLPAGRSILVETTDGMQTVSLVIDAYVKLSDKAASGNTDSTNSDKLWYLNRAETWSDGEIPSSGKDYLVDANPKSNLRTPSSAYVFPGRSLTLTKYLVLLGSKLTVTNFVLAGGALVQAAQNYTTHVVDGTMRFVNTSESSKVKFVVSNTRKMDIQSKITGDGFIELNSNDNNQSLTISGDNSSYTGQFDVDCLSGRSGTKLIFSAPENLGGAPSSFNYSALKLSRSSVLAPTAPMTLATANRGIYFVSSSVYPGRISVTNGTFGIMWPIRTLDTIKKEGAGTLALGGPVSFGADGTSEPTGNNNRLLVSAGGIMPLSTNGFARFSIAFSDATTRLVADASATDEGVRTFGLFNTYGAFTLPSDGKLRVRIDGCSDDVRRCVVPICTVLEGAAAALEGNIEVDRIKGCTVSVSASEPFMVNGVSMVRFVANVGRAGMFVIVR